MFTYEEYQEIVERLDDPYEYKNHVLLGSDVKKFCQKIGKTPIEFSAVELRDLILSRKLNHPTTIGKHLYVFRMFYELLKDESIRFDNPCDNQYLNVQYLVENSKRLPPFYSNLDITKMINRIDRDKPFYEGMIRTFYEGIARDSAEIYQMSVDDIDFITGVVQTPRGTKIISKRLLDAYKNVQLIDCFHDPHPRSRTGTRTTHCKREFYNALFPTSTSNIAQFYLYRMKHVSKMTGYDVTIQHLYYSGFLWYCCNAIGTDKIIELMLDHRRNTIVDTKIIKGLIEEYKFAISIDTIKYKMKPYIFSLKKSLAENADI